MEMPVCARRVDGIVDCLQTVALIPATEVRVRSEFKGLNAHS